MIELRWVTKQRRSERPVAVEHDSSTMVVERYEVLQYRSELTIDLRYEEGVKYEWSEWLDVKHGGVIPLPQKPGDKQRLTDLPQLRGNY